MEKIFAFLEVRDLARKLFLMLSVLYLLFFSLETVLPGTVIEVFNFNWLLLGWLATLFFLLVIEKKEEMRGTKGSGRGAFFFIFCLILLLALVFFLVLYKVGLAERVFYLLLMLIFLRFLIGRMV